MILPFRRVSRETRESDGAHSWQNFVQKETLLRLPHFRQGDFDKGLGIPALLPLLKESSSPPGTLGSQDDFAK